MGKRLIKSPKLYFPDVGLNRAVSGGLAVSPGAACETWVYAELLKWKQLQPLKPELYYYRTAAGLEVDFLLAGHPPRNCQRPQGWAPRSTVAGFGMQLQPKRTDNFEDGVEAWATFAGKVGMIVATLIAESFRGRRVGRRT